ncbi:MAG TPA: hypothetical protein VM366_13865 [Anaerolineae bacterium]|nr:hypothetical protein [Anaerolineae bacterium]
MMETAYLVAYQEAHAGWWHDVAGCDRPDVCQEIAGNGAKANPHRQYGVFVNEPQWWMSRPEYVCGLSDRELYRHTYGAYPAAA